MGASKDKFMEQREMEVFCIVPESVYNSLDSKQRTAFKYSEFRESNEYEENKSDATYMELYRANKKTKKALQEYLFNKRHR